jgi:hypothetical protein
MEGGGRKTGSVMCTGPWHVKRETLRSPRHGNMPPPRPVPGSRNGREARALRARCGAPTLLAARASCRRRRLSSFAGSATDGIAAPHGSESSGVPRGSRGSRDSSEAGARGPLLLLAWRREAGMWCVLASPWHVESAPRERRGRDPIEQSPIITPAAPVPEEARAASPRCATRSPSHQTVRGYPGRPARRRACALRRQAPAATPRRTLSVEGSLRPPRQRRSTRRSSLGTMCTAAKASTMSSTAAIAALAER